MTNKKYFLRVREGPFLFGGIKIVVSGKAYYVKHRGYNGNEAINAAKKFIEIHHKSGLEEKLDMESKSW